MKKNDLLFHYYENIAEYGKAEDVLFEVLDQNVNRNIVVPLGIAFYERLALKSPDELEKGNLPLHEVLEGMEKIRSLEGYALCLT